MRQSLRSKKKLKTAKGYGLAMLMMFVASSLMIATSLQLVAAPVGLAYMGGASQNTLSARQIAESGIAAAKADIQSRLNSLQSVTTSYTLSNSISMPSDPSNPNNLNSSLGSYTASITYARGNLYVLKVTGSVGSATETIYQLLNLGISHQKPLDYTSGATAAFGLRKLRSAYSGSAIRVRRPSDNTEQDIGFLPDGSLDLYSLKSFLGSTLPLDSVPGAAAAYSLRKLRSAYTGPAIRVRRSSDSTTLDIGFTSAGNLDVATLMSFVGSGTGYVTHWFDQSGNGQDGTSLRNTSWQPYIVLNGVLQMMNGKPAIRYYNGDQEMNLPMLAYDNFTLTTVYNETNGYGSATADDAAYSMAMIINSDLGGYGKNDYCVGIDTAGYPTGTVGNGDGSNDYSTYATTPGPVNDGKMHWLAFTRDKTTSQFTIYNDRGSYSRKNGNTNSLTDGGWISLGWYVNGYINESIIYTSVLSRANLATLQQDESRYWNVPVVLETATPVDSVNNVQAAYGLRQLKANWGNYADQNTEFAIRVRRSSDNTEKDIGFKQNTWYTNPDLDIATLLSFVGSGNGYVTKWYDQSGNGRHAAQTSTSQQPLIVSSGSLVQVNGRPAIKFDSTRIDVLQTAAQAAWPSGTANRTMNVVYKFNTTGNYPALLKWGSTGTGTLSAILQDGGGLGFWGFNADQKGPYGIDTQNLHTISVVINSGTANVYVDGTSSVSGAVTINTAASTPLFIGAATGSSNPLSGYISEVVVSSNAVNDTNRSNLERDQLKYYAPQNQVAYVTKWYDQSGNNNHVVQTNPMLQPYLSFQSDGGNTTMPTVVFDNVASFGGPRLSGTTGFPTNSNYSLSAVFSYRNSALNNNIISSSVDTATANHALMMGSTNYLRLWHWADFATSGTALTTNKQYAVAATYLNSSKTGTTYQANTSVGSSVAANANTDTSIQLGSHVDGHPLNGTISEAIVFNKVLSTAERTALYQSQVATYGAL